MQKLTSDGKKYTNYTLKGECTFHVLWATKVNVNNANGFMYILVVLIAYNDGTGDVKAKVTEIKISGDNAEGLFVGTQVLHGEGRQFKDLAIIGEIVLQAPTIYSV